MLRGIQIALISVSLCALSALAGTAARAATTATINGSFVSAPAAWQTSGQPDQIYEAMQWWYGYAPSVAPWSQNFWVFPPTYSDIWGGGPTMASILSAFPAGDLNVVTHSHGGNVAILSTYYMYRPLRTLINLATPINWDLYGYLGGAGAYWRCQVSSSADWVQFIGASPTQILNFAYAVYASIVGAISAFDALVMGDYWTALAYFQYAVFEVIVADYWWYTTKIEVEGPTYMFSGLGHEDLHTAGVWNAIAPYCA
jgi:hypothetical protein